MSTSPVLSKKRKRWQTSPVLKSTKSLTKKFQRSQSPAIDDFYSQLDIPVLDTSISPSQLVVESDIEELSSGDELVNVPDILEQDPSEDEVIPSDISEEHSSGDELFCREQDLPIVRSNC